ncbi:MAG: trk system potassium uptake protein TrkA [Salinirussus sp.]|jgi:trk system potassium uptake protein TrkA
MSAQNTRNAIVVGGGRVGQRTAAKITERGYTVTVIEADEERAEQLSVPPSSRVIVGSGADIDVFKEANPTMTDVVAGLTGDTETNLAVCELAHELVPEVTTVLRIGADGEQDYAYLNHVDNVVYPAAAGASVAATQITGG